MCISARLGETHLLVQDLGSAKNLTTKHLTVKAGHCEAQRSLTPRLTCFTKEFLGAWQMMPFALLCSRDLKIWCPIPLWNLFEFVRMQSRLADRWHATVQDESQCPIALIMLRGACQEL